MLDQDSLLVRALAQKPLIYINVVSEAKSGLARKMRVHVVYNGELYDVTYEIAGLLDMPFKDGILSQRGGNMDMRFQLCHCLSGKVYGTDNKIKYRTV